MNGDIHRQEAIIDEALTTYPQTELPPGFINRVMSKVEVLPQVQPERFYLHFLDIVLALCFGGIVASILIIIFAAFGIVDIEWLSSEALFSLSSMYAIPASARFWLILGIVLFAEIGLGTIVCVQLWQDRSYAIA